MSTKAEVFSILERHMPSYLLKDYANGILNEKRDMLYAFSFTDVNPELYEDYWYVNQFDAYSSLAVEDEPCRIYSEDGKSYTCKDMHQCMKEGIYKSLVISFYGCYYDNRWIILRELKFYGSLISREDSLYQQTASIEDQNIFQSSYYQPSEKHFPIYNKNEKPLSRGVEFSEFVGIPELAAYVLQKEKMDLLWAHKQYLNLDIVLPFMQQLRANRFEEFSQISTFRGYPNYELICSTQRQYVLMPVIVTNSKKEKYLYYFFWHSIHKTMYRWKYFDLLAHSQLDYGEAVIEHLSQLTYWDSDEYLSNSCTLDDEYFWEHHVLAKENSTYQYLEEVVVGAF